MRCVDCPFTLACYTGRLGHTISRGHTLSLCPKCGRLNFYVGHNEYANADTDEGEKERILAIVRIAFVYFKCEQRSMIPKWSEKYRRIVKQYAAQLAAGTSTEDVKSTQTLVLVQCPVCDVEYLGGMCISEPVYDLDEAEELMRFLDEMY